MASHDDLDLTIRKLQAEDGDLVVLTSTDPLPRAAVEYLHDKLTTILNALGVNAKVLVLDHGLDIKVIRTSQLQPVETEDKGA